MNSDYRYEIKFVLDNASLADVMQWLYNNTTANKSYDNRMVNSIYFDDLDFSSVSDNLAGVPNRLKTRLRWYQSKKNQHTSIPVLEQKIKTGRLGMKSSVTINLAFSVTTLS